MLLKRLFNMVAVGILAVSLSGCTAVLPLSVWYFLGGITIASLATAKKLPSDVIADLDTGLDCDLTRSLSEGTEYCQLPEELLEKSIDRRYCYRSIGSITCYKEPNPYLDNSAEVGSLDSSIKAP